MYPMVHLVISNVEHVGPITRESASCMEFMRARIAQWYSAGVQAA
jgi:hypothetical protein